MAKKKQEDHRSVPTARSGLRQVMGDLEAEIMDCVWDHGRMTVKDVHQCLLEKREIAYTTVMTVMSRLTAKGLLVSQPQGRAYLYEASLSREAYCAAIVLDFMSDMLGDGDRSVLTHFVESVTEHDRAQLDLLAQIIEEKRRDKS